MQPVFRFAPSPNGALHLGHALSALINFEAARRVGGRFLLRLEDIDTVRCTEEKISQMLEDLAWLGLEWESPVVRQSERFPLYRKSLDRLGAQGLLYPSTASRKQIQQAITAWEAMNGKDWPRDPDGSPHFPRQMLQDFEQDSPDAAWRLDMPKTLNLRLPMLEWQESGPRSATYPENSSIQANPAQWGDVVLARKDCPTSYHLAVVVDDAAQGITHIVRGQDLFATTGLHRLLQQLLEHPTPLYHHHRLLTDVMGEKLSKSRGDLSLKSLRADGVTPSGIRQLINWNVEDLAAFRN